jgi:hypothetical protein
MIVADTIEEGTVALDSDASHQGVVFNVFDLADADETGGRPVRADNWLGVAWAAILRNGGGNGMFIGCRASAYYDLPEGTMDDEVRDQLLSGAHDFMRRLVESGRVIADD